VRKKRAPETRILLAALKSKMARKGAESEEIVIEFEKLHDEVIMKEIADHKRISLMKLVNEVGARRTSSSAAQMEMFKEYDVPDTLLFRLSDGRKIHRHTQSLTPLEAREHIEDRTKPRARVPEEIKELARLLDDIEPHKVSDKSTIGQCWAVFRESRGS
jgi:hypothetical protein